MSLYCWKQPDPEDIRRYQRVMRRRRLGAKFPSTLAELVAIAAASNVPVKRLPTGYAVGSEPECPMVITAIMMPSGGRRRGIGIRTGF